MSASVLALVLSFVGAGAVHPLGTLALLSGAPTTLSTMSAGTIFRGGRTVSAWDVGNSSSGTEADKSDPLSFAGDALTETTGLFATAFSTTRYMQWDYNDSVAAGLAASGVAFNVRVIPMAGTQTACWYLEVRRASTNALLGTHGSSGSPYACATGATFNTVAVPLPEVTSTDIADDLRIKLFVNETAAKGIKVDLAVVTGSTAYGTFSLYEKTETDSSTGTAVVRPWSLATVDANAFTGASNWTTAFAATRYLLFTFDPGVPAGSTVTGASLAVVYQSSTTASSCYYIEIYSGATLIGTHGSTAAPVSCATNAAWVTDTIALPEINSVARTNGVAVKLYAKSSGSRKTLHDRIALTVTYSRP